MNSFLKMKHWCLYRYMLLYALNSCLKTSKYPLNLQLAINYLQLTTVFKECKGNDKKDCLLIRILRTFESMYKQKYLHTSGITFSGKADYGTPHVILLWWKNRKHFQIMLEQMEPETFLTSPNIWFWKLTYVSSSLSQVIRY